MTQLVSLQTESQVFARVRPILFSHLLFNTISMSPDLTERVTILSLSERIPGLRPDAPRRNVLVILSYLLLFFIGVGLVDRFIGLPF
jgi:hypothetical protein